MRYDEKGLIAPSKKPDNQYRTFTEEEAWGLQTHVSREIRKVLEEVDRGHEQTFTEKVA